MPRESQPCVMHSGVVLFLRLCFEVINFYGPHEANSGRQSWVFGLVLGKSGQTVH